MCADEWLVKLDSFDNFCVAIAAELRPAFLGSSHLNYITSNNVSTPFFRQCNACFVQLMSNEFVIINLDEYMLGYWYIQYIYTVYIF